MSIDLSVIEWETPPPPKSTNRSTGSLTPKQVAVAASMRPGVWGSIESPYGPSNAGIFSHRLREAGIESVSRGNRAYFRAGGDA